MTETAVPIAHSIYEGVEFISDAAISPSEKAICDLALTPGFELLEKEIKAEIARLKEVEYTEGETVEQYGFKCLASSLCVSKLEWIINRVRATESAVRESTT